jgi:hypothetical protein
LRTQDDKAVLIASQSTDHFSIPQDRNIRVSIRLASTTLAVFGRPLIRQIELSSEHT